MYHRVLYLLSLLVLTLCALPCPAEGTVSSPRTEVSLTSEVSSIQAGQKFWLALHLVMQPGWHTYWKNPGESGMEPKLQWTLPKGFSASDVQFPAPDVLQAGELVDYGYVGELWLPVQVEVPGFVNDNVTAIIQLKAGWLVCKDVCIPESGEFSLTLPVASASQKSDYADAIQGVIKTLPEPLKNTARFIQLPDATIRFETQLPVLSAESIKAARFFPDNEGFIANTPVQNIVLDADKLYHGVFTLAKAEGKIPDKASGLISLFMENGERRNYTVVLNAAENPLPDTTRPPAPHADFSAVVGAVLLAFAGGILLNLMPCVFPVLSLKAVAIAKKAQKNGSIARKHGIAYSLGVISSFIALAVVLILIRSGGQSLGWGYQMQSPLFVTVLLVVLFLVGLNLSGLFEVRLAGGNLGSHVAAKENWLGSFATGALAVLVATPCTAPFMATAIGFALSQGAVIILLIFTSLGLGLAAPFLLISFSPRLITLLPRPGEWMNRFRQFAAFPMYLSCVWLLWVLMHETGSDQTVMVMVALVMLAFAVWLYHSSWRFIRLAALLVFVLALYLAFSPVQGTTEADRAEKFSIARLEALRSEGRGVLVDATADWCITCKVNEHLALSSASVKKQFAAQKITVLVADWTNSDAGITQYLQSFGRAGVPLYVYYPAGRKNPVILPQILTEAVVLETIR